MLAFAMHFTSASLPIALLGVLLAPFADAQDAVLLTPTAHTVRQGETLRLNIEERTPAAALAAPWPAELSWFFVRLAGTQENRTAEVPPRERPQELTPALPGVAMIGVDLPPRESKWTPDEFASFARVTGCDDAPPATDAKVLILASATTLVRVNDAAGVTADDTTATTKSGQKVEIRPLMDPTTLAAGSDLPVRVYVQGEAVRDAIVLATHTPSGATVRARADTKGIAHLRIDQPGAWRIELRSLRAPTKDADRWTIASASLSFESPAKQEAAK
jgi:hypothetical protein